MITTPDPQLPQDHRITIRYGVATSPFGDCLIADTPRGLCQLSFIDDSIESTIDELRTTWPLATLDRNDPHACLLMKQALTDPSSIRLHVHASPFQLAIWNALRKIPHGKTVSYQKLAATAGHPTAIRAAGTAIGKNPIALLIPCHRVIRNDGSLGNYHWGSNRKRAILDFEISSNRKSKIKN